MSDHVCPSADRATPREDEQHARMVLDGFVEGELVVWDDNSVPRMWDFCVVGPDGTHAATVEVTRNTKESLRRLSEQLFEQGGSTWEAPSYLLRRWAVQFEHTARPLRIQTKIFRLLKQAELGGHSHIGSRYGMPMHNEAHGLGIWSAIDLGDRNGEVYVVPGPSGWWGDHGHVTDGLLAEAQDNEEKLRSAPAPRHLVIWVDYAAVAATFEMTERGPTQEPVRLPSYVDVAWALCGEADLNGAAVWRAEDGQPWSVLRGFSFHP